MMAGPIYRKYEKALKTAWNPRELDYASDEHDWQRLAEDRRRGLLGITVRFFAGEQRVTDELLPMLAAAHALDRYDWTMFRSALRRMRLTPTTSDSSTMPLSPAPRGASQEIRPPAGELDVVTGAFGFTGKEVTRRLLAAGRRVRTLTGYPARPHPFGTSVEIAPLAFDDPALLESSLGGAHVLYNTYWIRFSYRSVTYEQAVSNSHALLRAARAAGVERVVHISIVNASEGSAFPYFRGKAIVERELRASGLSYAILRPTVLFGLEGILINNIAWLLRHSPLFLVPGSGTYRLQPVSVEDVADLAVEAGAGVDDLEQDVAGPETFTFEDFVRLLAQTVGSRARILHSSPRLALLLTGLVGAAVRDVILTRDELAGLMGELLVSNEPPAGQTSLSAWLAANTAAIGRRYQSELERHYRRPRSD